MRRTVLIFFSLYFIAAGFSSAGFCQESQEKTEKFVAEYRIGPRDLLEIKVAGGDKFNMTARVSEEGKITIPYVGEIVVDGLTSSELEKKLSQILEEKYLHNPQVSVFIKEFQSKRVSVLGAVSKPGPYELLGRQTLLQIISAAGGLTKDAAKEIILIRRLPDGESTRLSIPIEDLFFKGEAKYDIPLEPGDIVNVQVDRVVQIYIMGQVKSPGALQVLRSRLPTLIQAIAQAGGFTERAAESRVIVKRKDASGNEKEIKIDAKAILKNKRKDFQLEENDVVYVPETLF
jgi:polysaccharide export outer membrane protein